MYISGTANPDNAGKAGKMSERLERVNSLLQECIAEIIMRKLKDPRITGLITVHRVETSKDLMHAKVVITILANNDAAAHKSFEALQHSAAYIQFLLKKEVRIRYIPNLHFVIDEKQDEAFRIIDKINSMHIHDNDRLSGEEEHHEEETEDEDIEEESEE